MPMTVAEILQAARMLPDEERASLLHALQEDEFAEWEGQFGEPEPGYDAWFRAGVEEALADDSPYKSHEDVVRGTAEILQAARERKRLKASA